MSRTLDPAFICTLRTRTRITNSVAHSRRDAKETLPMAKQRLWLAGGGLVFLTAPRSALLAGPPAGDKTGAVATSDVKALADKIDRHLAGRWAAAKVTPVARADDAEFLRRVYLDIAGHIPSVSEARRFLEDNKPDKRHRLVT